MYFKIIGREAPDLCLSRILYDNSNVFDVLKKKFETVEFEPGLPVLEFEKAYSGIDSDKNILKRFVTKRVFNSSDVFCAPFRPGGRWMADIANLLQGIIGKNGFCSLKTDDATFHDTRTIDIFKHTQSLLLEITEDQAKKIYRVGKTHSEVTTIVCSEKSGDFFQSSFSCLKLYLFVF